MRSWTAAASLVVLLAACGGGGDDDGATATTVDPTLPKAALPYLLCKTAPAEDASVSPDIEVFVENLVRQASLPEAPAYEESVVRCDNTGVTSIEAPSAYADVDPGPFSPPQTAIRVSPDLSANVEAEPIINFFAASVGGSQYPTQPGFATLIQQSADGSLSSGTRDPREGSTISEECQGLPVRDLDIGDLSGKARFFVNCGDEPRAWVLVAAAPSNGEPYFVQVVAHVLDTADAEALGRALSSMQVDQSALEALAAEQDAAAAAATSTTVAGGSVASTETTAVP